MQLFKKYLYNTALLYDVEIETYQLCSDHLIYFAFEYDTFSVDVIAWLTFYPLKRDITQFFPTFSSFVAKSLSLTYICLCYYLQLGYIVVVCAGEQDVTSNKLP